AAAGSWRTKSTGCSDYSVRSRQLQGRSAGRPVSRVLCRPPELPPADATAIYLAAPLPARSSSLPGGHGGPDRSCPHIWPCFRWGLPSRPVTRPLVRSYRTFSPLPHGSLLKPRLQAQLPPGGILSVALSRFLRTVGVTHHRVL